MVIVHSPMECIPEALHLPQIAHLSLLRSRLTMVHMCITTLRISIVSMSTTVHMCITTLRMGITTMPLTTVLNCNTITALRMLMVNCITTMVRNQSHQGSQSRTTKFSKFHITPTIMMVHNHTTKVHITPTLQRHLLLQKLCIPSNHSCHRSTPQSRV